MTDDLISVVLPVYNGSKFLERSINSILKQTHHNLELIIINDGSTDDSLKKIMQCARNDSRILVISRENKGLVYTLNEGIKLASGTYIARMDADDYSMPTRLQNQLAFLIKNDLDLCGTDIFVRNNYFKIIRKYPVQIGAIKIALLFGSTHAHPTILAKAQTLQQNPYNPNYKHCEDYELWTRLVNKGYKLGNLPEPQLIYQIHFSQISQLQNPSQVQLSKKIAQQYWHYLFSNKINDELITKVLNIRYDKKGDFLDINEIAFLINLLNENTEFDLKNIKRDVAIILLAHAPLGIEFLKTVLQYFRIANLQFNHSVKIVLYIAFLLKLNVLNWRIQIKCRKFFLN